MTGRRLRIAVVGAGPSGLCCIKNAIEFGHDVTAYEQNSAIGGTWIYTDHVGLNEFGLPEHSSMYKNLLTNVPVETMGFLDFPFPKKQRSFVPHEEVLAFLHSYADNFNLMRVIKFGNHVIRVTPLEGNSWEVLSKDLRSDKFETKQFDAIFVCNGHWNKAYTPDFKGLSDFQGRKIHSHDYRQPDIFKDETLLIIGNGPSGKDICYEAANTAKQVFISGHHDFSTFICPPNVKVVGNVLRFTEDKVHFEDGKEEIITSILFCTGYEYSFPFLSVDCGLSMRENRFVEPLYMHLFNIRSPTMAIIGLQICAFTFVYDLQARLCLRVWNGEIELPPKAQMLSETKAEMNSKEVKGIPFRKWHFLNEERVAYIKKLSDFGKLTPMPEVLHKIYDDTNDLRVSYSDSYREFNYTIIDESNFTRERIPKTKTN